MSAVLRALLLGALLLAGGCSERPEPEAARAGPPAAALSPEAKEQLSVSPVLTVSPAEMRAALEAAYRLPPDARVLRAVADIPLILGGTARGRVDLTYRDGTWHIAHDGDPVGSLSQFADFPEILSLLSAWGRRHLDRQALPGRAGAVAGRLRDALHGFEADGLRTAVRRLDARWRNGERDIAGLAQAATALTYLMLRTPDDTGAADALGAKALAALALATAGRGGGLEKDTVLLAYALGYSGFAVAEAAGLRDGDPVRAFFEYDDERLRRYAEGPRANGLSRFLMLQRLAERGAEDAWRAWGETYLGGDPGAMVKTGRGMDGSEARRQLASALPLQVYGTLLAELGEVAATGAARTVEEDGGFARTALAAFEPRLSELVSQPLGPFLDADALRAVYRGPFRGGLMILGADYLAGRSEAIGGFQAMLAAARDPWAIEFAGWYRALADSDAGASDRKVQLSEQLVEAEHLGVPARAQAMAALAEVVDRADPLAPLAARTLTERLDGRPAHRALLASVARTVLMDLDLAERLYARAIDADPLGSRADRAWFAGFTGDAATLRGLLDDRRLDSPVKVEALKYLRPLPGVSDDALRRAYRRLVDQAPDAWPVRSAYAEYLGEQGEHRAIPGIIVPWLDRHGQRRPVEAADARILLAEAYLKLGRRAQAWYAVEPLLGSRRHRTQGRVARVLEGLGDPDQAGRLLQARVEHYPDSFRAVADLAAFHWRQGRDRDAATTLRAWPRRIGRGGWYHVLGERFTEAFGEREPIMGVAAARTLLEAGVPPVELREAITVVGEAGHAALAFELSAVIPDDGAHRVLNDILAYGYLKAWKGAAAAAAWLKPRVDADNWPRVAATAYAEGEFAVLWDVVEEPMASPYTHFLWLLRAAAAVREGLDTHPHRQALVDQYNWPGLGIYRLLGRYHLGLISEAAVLRAADTPGERCDAAYHLGVKAEAEGRLVDANGWYRVAVETGIEDCPGQAWAYDALRDWQRRDKSLGRLVAERSPD